MPLSRQTFVVQVHEDQGFAVVENVRTCECVPVQDMAEIGLQIERWVGRPLDRRNADSRRDSDASPNPDCHR